MATTTVTTTPVDPAQRVHLESGAPDLIDYRPGAMDTRAHEKTFSGFVTFLTWNVVAIVLILIFLTLAGA